MDKLEGQQCPFCKAKKLTLLQDEIEIPFFGKVFAFSMNCTGCGVRQSDVEAAEPKDPCKVTFTTESEADMKVRIVKSSQATVKLPGLRMSVEPGSVAEGYVSNVEGLLGRFEKVVESQRDNSDDDGEKKSAKNLLKKMRKIKYGEIPLKIVIEDPSGNSAIISKKAIIEKLKGKKK